MSKDKEKMILEFLIELVQCSSKYNEVTVDKLTHVDWMESEDTDMVSTEI